MPLRFCLTVDVEDFISFKQINPMWNFFDRFKGKINTLIKDFRYNKKGFNKVYKIIVKNKFPCSFMLVGSMFKPRDNYEFIDWGYHGYKHLPFTKINDTKLKTELKNKFNAVSITAPLWLVEDQKNPKRIYQMIKKEDYKICVCRKPEFLVTDINIKYGITRIYLSGCFEGNSSKKHMVNLFEDIKKNINKDGIYCLSTHDFTHRNTKNLERVIKFIKENRIESVNLRQLVK